jgi:D-alanyl-D-alanine carboxypeptidase
VWTPAQALSYEKKPLFAPGTSWAYSNTGYVLLGQLVEQVTGTSYATLLRQRFFDPLGLTSTYVQYLEPARQPVAHAYQFFTYYRSEKPTSLWDGTGISPFMSVLTAAGSAGSVASSARDLAIWAKALYSGKVLGPGGLTQMLNFAPTKSFFRYNDPYGLGVQQYPINGLISYGHDGRLLGARATIRYIPSLNVSIAVVMNTDRGDSAGIATQLLTLVAPPVPKPTPSPSARPSPSTAPSASVSATP